MVRVEAVHLSTRAAGNAAAPPEVCGWPELLDFTPPCSSFEPGKTMICSEQGTMAVMAAFEGKSKAADHTDQAEFTVLPQTRLTLLAWVGLAARTLFVRGRV